MGGLREVRSRTSAAPHHIVHGACSRDGPLVIRVDRESKVGQLDLPQSREQGVFQLQVTVGDTLGCSKV